MEAPQADSFALLAKAAWGGGGSAGPGTRSPPPPPPPSRTPRPPPRGLSANIWLGGGVHGGVGPPPPPPPVQLLAAFNVLDFLLPAPCGPASPPAPFGQPCPTAASTCPGPRGTVGPLSPTLKRYSAPARLRRRHPSRRLCPSKQCRVPLRPDTKEHGPARHPCPARLPLLPRISVRDGVLFVSVPDGRGGLGLWFGVRATSPRWSVERWPVWADHKQ